MDAASSEGSEVRFAAYVEALGAVLGHADRQLPMHATGIFIPSRAREMLPSSGCGGPSCIADGARSGCSTRSS